MVILQHLGGSMNKEKQLISLYSWINDCWRLALSHDTWEAIKEELGLPEIIVTSWEQEGWTDAYNRIDNVIKNIKRLAKEKPAMTNDCKMLKFRVDMIKDGVENILDKEFGLKVYCRNGEIFF